MRRVCYALALLLTLPAAGFAQNGRPQIITTERRDVSPPLRDIPPAPRATGELEAEPARRIPSNRIPPIGPDPALQQGTALATRLAPTPLLNFDGVGQGFIGPAGTFTVNSAPPDTNGAVGPNHYVQTVNSDFAIFNKSGTPIYGPVTINTLWSGFGGGCQNYNNGDPVVVYDRIADQWLISQFAVTTTPYLQCVAVSQTGDPTGAYYRYSFNYGNTAFPDYPKMGVWPDAYYITYNIFNGGTTFAGAKICAFDRTRMLTGAAATQQCFNTSTSYGGLLPGDFDGTTLPPAGAPNPLVALGATSSTLALWKFHVDWTTPANTTFAGPTALSVPAYAGACGGGTCIPQSGTRQQLDSLADRLMYRAAYRNFGDHEALVVNHSVTAGSSVGLRWYELRGVTGTASYFQVGTYAPDAGYRWMGSIAMDHGGNMALGYSASSSSLKPQIRFTGRLAGDAAGTMTQGESTILAGNGVQTGGLSRWGDYSAMQIDPVDDCTFWFTTEYIPSDGAFNWKTRIASFKLPSCSTSPDFSLAASPSPVTVVQGATATSTITVTPTGGFADAVTLGLTGLPGTATASFSPNSTAGTSTLTISTGSTAPGTYPLTVTGASGALNHSTPLGLTIVVPDFSLSASPTTVTVAAGANGTSTITITPSNGFAGSVSLGVAPLPSGATASFSPNPATGSSMLTLNSGTATPGAYPLTVRGTSGALSHTTLVSFTIQQPQSFTLSATPASRSVLRLGSTTYAVALTRVVGFTGNVSLSVTGLPSGVSGSFNPQPVSGTASTLTISAGKNATRGTQTLTITGTSSGASAASTTVSLTVN